MASEVRTEHPHVVIVKGPGGLSARVKGTGILVCILAALYNRGETPTGLLMLYPDLTAASLYDALSYYFDHKAEIDGEIEANKPERVLTSLRQDPNLIEVRPGVFEHKRPFESEAS